MAPFLLYKMRGLSDGMQFAALATESLVRRVLDTIWYFHLESFFWRMASSFSSAAEGCNEQKKKASVCDMRRSCSSNAASFGNHAAKSCVCAPTTHAGSFKCRLHRGSLMF